MKEKKDNMAEATGYRDAVVFDCQKQAHKKFFEDELPNSFKPLPKRKRDNSDLLRLRVLVVFVSGGSIVLQFEF